MGIEGIYGALLEGRVLISSRDVNALLKLCFSLLEVVVSRGLRVYILDEKGIASRYIPIDIAEKAVFVMSHEEACRNGDKLLIVLLPRYVKRFIKCKQGKIILLTTRAGFELPGFTKYQLKRIPGTSEYVMKSLTTGVTYRLRFTNTGIVEVESPPGLLGKAYDVIKETLVNYGEVSIRDGVVILSRELGVDRKTARGILIKLARGRYIRVAKGRIELA